MSHLQQDSWTPTWPWVLGQTLDIPIVLIVTGVKDIISNSGCGRAMDPGMNPESVLSWNQASVWPLWLHNPQTPTWPQGTAQTLGILVTFSDNMDTDANCGCGSTMNSDMPLGSSPGPRHHQGPGWQAGLPHLSLFNHFFFLTQWLTIILC